MQRPLARHDKWAAVPMALLELALPFSPFQQLGLDFAQGHRKPCRPQVMGDLPDGLFGRPAIKTLKAPAPEYDLAVQRADHRWAQIQRMGEFLELCRFCLELRLR